MSADRLRLLAGVLSTLGVAVAGYLTYVHYSGLRPICEIAHGCETVQSSQYAFLAGIPVALLGLLLYVMLLAAAITRSEIGLLASFCLALIGCCFSLYLTSREAFTIHAICSWCVASAIIMTSLAVLGAVRVFAISDRTGVRASASEAAGSAST